MPFAPGPTASRGIADALVTSTMATAHTEEAESVTPTASPEKALTLSADHTASPRVDPSCST